MSKHHKRNKKRKDKKDEKYKDSKPSMYMLPRLLKANNKEGDLDEMIELAKMGGYDDFKWLEVLPNTKFSDRLLLFTGPKVMLLHDLKKFPRLKKLEEMVISGTFDDKADEDDKEILRKQIREDFPKNVHKMMFKELNL